MKAKRVLVLLVAILMVFSLVACSKGEGGGNAVEKPSPVGTYTLSSMEEGGEEVPQDDLNMLAEMGLKVTMEVKEDGTGAIDLFGEMLEFTWDDNYITVDDQQQSYEFDGTNFSMTNDDIKMTFTKDAAQ